MQNSPVTGLHHLTACVGGAQDDIDFFTKIIGQSLIKKTVLFDGALPVYHLYYANQQGTPGTVMTTFPYRQHGIKAKKGSGQVKFNGLTVPAASMQWWVEHLNQHQVQHAGIETLFGHNRIRVQHPGGIEIELVGDDRDTRPAWTGTIPEAAAVRGLHSATLSVRDIEHQEYFLVTGLGFRKTAQEGNYHQYEIGAGGPGHTIILKHDADLPAGSWTFGEGTVHHLALAVQNDAEQKRVKDHLEGLGFTDVSESKDRNYFHSCYVRSPSGVLFEIATCDIGFAIDESIEELGTQMLLPPWLEARREEMISQLEPIRA